MLRVLAIAAMFALAVPTLAVAQVPGPPGKAAGKPVQRRGPVGPAGPHVGGPHVIGPHVVGPHVGGPHVGGPRVGLVGGPAGKQFGFHGKMINRVHLAPFLYPHGFRYQRWAVGLALPAVFLAPAYYYGGWGELGLSPPPPGYQWVRYGPDLLLVDTNTGQIADAAYGVFY